MIEPKECQLCLKGRIKDGDAPNKMVALPKLTKKRRIPVLVCPDCDGNALSFAKGSSNE